MKIKYIVADARKGYDKTIYVTKYALTRGILKVENAQLSHDYMYYYIDQWQIQINRNDWHHTASDAIKRAEEMRKARIESLKRQLANLEAMRFEEGEE